MALILASQSPRRRELLATLGVSFRAESVDIDETPHVEERPIPYVERLALEKAQAGYVQFADELDWVLGSDTTVVIDDTILGKPENFEHFQEIMQRLSGRLHQVVTAVAIVRDQQSFFDVVTTNVQFTVLNDELIEQYWRTGEPQDKAGGYGIQGLGSVLVKDIQGSYSNVVGLPLHETAKILSKAELPIWHGGLLLP